MGPALVAEPDSYSVNEDGALTVNATNGLLANDFDTTGSFEADSFSEPAHGTLSVTTDGSFVYTPNSGFVGDDTFIYTDGDGANTSSATVTIDVYHVNPVANPDTYVVQAGKTLTVPAATGLLANDRATDGTLEAESFSTPAHGTLAVTTDGSFVYTPNAGFVGDDTFTYTDSDGVAPASATVTIDVVDSPPVASNDFYHTGVGVKLTVHAAQGLLKNDFDPDNDPIEATSFSTPLHGTLAVTTDGSFVYTPNASFSGTDTFTYTISDGTLTSSATASIVVGAPALSVSKVPGDFNGDGFSDILWQNIAGGQAAVWEMNGSDHTGGGPVSPNPGPSWTEVGLGDFDGDGHADILWQNTTGGQVAVWEMNGSARTGGGPVSPNPGPDWKAIGSGDFNGDGLSDILFQNTTSGQASVWEMNGNTLIGGGAVSPNPGLAWKAVGTGDFNGDGDADILFQNTSTGQVSIWEMNGDKLIGGGPVSPNPGPAWKAIGTGDFNDDGHSDILFQNTTSGQVSIWEMNGNKLIGGGPVSPNPGPSWHAIGTGDFNGDGHSDILFQNTSGQASVWEMNGNTLMGGGPVSPNPGPSWRTVA